MVSFDSDYSGGMALHLFFSQVSFFSFVIFFGFFCFFFFCMDLSLGGFLIEVDETGKNFAILANLWESYLSTPCVLGWLQGAVAVYRMGFLISVVDVHIDAHRPNQVNG